MITAKKDKKTSESDSSSNKNTKNYPPEVSNLITEASKAQKGILSIYKLI